MSEHTAAILTVLFSMLGWAKTYPMMYEVFQRAARMAKGENQ